MSLSRPKVVKVERPQTTGRPYWQYFNLNVHNYGINNLIIKSKWNKKTTYKIRVGYDWTLNLVATDGNLVQSTLPNLTFVLYIAWATWDQTGSSLLPEKKNKWINNKVNKNPPIDLQWAHQGA